MGLIEVRWAASGSDFDKGSPPELAASSEVPLTGGGLRTRSESRRIMPCRSVCLLDYTHMMCGTSRTTSSDSLESKPWTDNRIAIDDSSFRR